jgi:aerobic-type carbon monoxide dehydrogenase small subunit (CoxS/CutS family)
MTQQNSEQPESFHLGSSIGTAESLAEAHKRIKVLEEALNRIHGILCGWYPTPLERMQALYAASRKARSAMEPRNEH